nr:unnamed protein product [Digitaria exilis]
MSDEQHVFKMEQEEYTKEEIDWSYIQFVDNQEILDLIEKKPGGIIALLDETCMLRNSTHETFAEKLYQKFKDNPHFSKPKFSRSDFTIHHYAGNVGNMIFIIVCMPYLGLAEVTYQTDLFLDKNIDYAVNEHQVLLNASKCSFVSSLFPPCEESTKSTKFTSIGSNFKQQLQSLLETLSATEPHYIRCVKPNNVLKPAIFENSNVLQQLRCGGVLEAIRISCLGYPTRRTFYEFVNRFGILQPKALCRSHDEVTAAKMLLDKANLTGYQSHCRSYLARSQYVKLMKAIITAQCGWRRRVARRELRNLKTAAKETGALQAAKSKLQKEVEELTWRLQLEKRIRADMEEARTQENKKLQLQLHEMQLQLKDTKDLLKREHETAKEASEKAAAVPEILADTARIDELTSEKERLKALHIVNFAMISLQEKLTNTEAENHVLRQQAMKARPDNMPLLNMHRKSNLANGSVHSDEQTPHSTPMEFGRGSVVERQNKQDNNSDLAYWLSNSSSLLIILQKSLKPPGSSGTTPMKRPQTQTSFLGRMVFRASNITVDMDLVRQVEAKYPALLFKQQLTAFVEGLYGMIRDNVKREISSVLSLVIQVTPSIESDPQVPTIFARKIFTQIFSFINAQLLNSLLVRRECCSFSNGEYVKQGLDELESWCTQAKPEYAVSAWDELKHICQAVGFLVIFKKFRISYDEVINDLCPVLSVQQMYKICTQYWDDKYNTESVSEEVLDEMRKVVNEGTAAPPDNTFLLDEEISMPLSLEEIANSMDAKEFQNVSPPQELLDNAAFQFLRS